MTYDVARAVLATQLAAVAISTPRTLVTKQVYTKPPAGEITTPAFILYGASGNVAWTFGGQEYDQPSHTEKFRSLVEDADSEDAFEVVQAFNTAVLAALKSQGGLGGTVTVAALSWGEPVAFPYQKRLILGQEFELEFVVKDWA